MFENNHIDIRGITRIFLNISNDSSIAKLLRAIKSFNLNNPISKIRYYLLDRADNCNIFPAILILCEKKREEIRLCSSCSISHKILIAGKKSLRVCFRSGSRGKKSL